MRSTAGTKAATRSTSSTQGFRKIKPKGRATSPSAGGASRLKRVPGRDLVVVTDATKPKIIKPEVEANPEPLAVKPLSPQEQRIELFGASDEDEIAWKHAYDAARHTAARRHAQAQRKMARRMRQWRLVLNYSVAGTLSIMIGIGASVVAHDMRMGNFAAPEWFKVLTPATKEAPAMAVVRPSTAPASEAALEDMQTASIPPDPKPAKTIAMAHLAVEDVEGVALQYIPLDISAEPSGPDEKLAIRLSGLPDDAMLTTGRKLPDGSWLVDDGNEETVKLVLPSLTSGKVALGVEALTMPSGEEATPMKEMTVSITPAKADLTVVPVAGAAQQASFDKGGPISLNLSKDPVPMRLTEATQQSLPDAVPPPDEALPQPAAGIAARGDQALKNGDVAGARSFYMRAFEQGNLAAAAGVARTYDPAIFKQLKVRGLKPNPAKARDWYAKAADAGDAEAGRRAAALQATP